MSRENATFVCFMTTGVEDWPKRKQTYEAIKAHVLAAGEFSVFEATATQHLAGIFDRMRKDPELVFTIQAFPWTKVEPASAERKGETK